MTSYSMWLIEFHADYPVKDVFKMFPDTIQIFL